MIFSDCKDREGQLISKVMILVDQSLHTVYVRDVGKVIVQAICEVSLITYAI